MSNFKSLVVDERNKEIVSEVIISHADSLPKGDLLVKVVYSSLNYIDALIMNGNKDIVKKYPHTAGIDAVGIVVESNSQEFCVDDEVVITGFGLGVDVPGGFGEYVRISSSWATHIPTGLTMKDCMTLGSDGIAASFAVMELMTSGNYNIGDNVVVSGAGFGIGSIGVALLELNGFEVTAVVKDHENGEFTKILGAKEVIFHEKFVSNTQDKLLEDKYSLAIDTLGGDALSTITRSLKRNGSVVVCSSMVDSSVTMPLNPFTDRGINIIGISSINSPLKLKQEAWRKLSGEWYIKKLPLLCTEISILEVPEYSKRLINGNIKGRIVINYEI